MMRRKIIAAALVAALTNPADAAVTTLTFLDGGGTPHNGAFTTDSVSSDFIPLGAICGGTSPLTGVACVNQAEVNSSGQLSTLSSVGTWAAGTLGAMANYGTSPGAVLVPGVNAFMTNALATGQQTPNLSLPTVLPAAQVSTDPCYLNPNGAKTTIGFSSNAVAIQLVAPVSVTSVYVCAIDVVNTLADSVSLVEGLNTLSFTVTSITSGVMVTSTSITLPFGTVLSSGGIAFAGATVTVGGTGTSFTISNTGITGSGSATGTAPCIGGTPTALAGSIVAASGMDFAANHEWSRGNGGAYVMSTSTSGHGLCLLQTGTTGGTTKLAGSYTVIQE